METPLNNITVICSQPRLLSPAASLWQLTGIAHFHNLSMPWALCLAPCSKYPLPSTTDPAQATYMAVLRDTSRSTPGSLEISWAVAPAHPLAQKLTPLQMLSELRRPSPHPAGEMLQKWLLKLASIQSNLSNNP